MTGRINWCLFGTKPLHGSVMTERRVTHICVSKLNSISSDNGLSTGRCQAIIWTNAGILSNYTFGTYFSEILSGIHTFPFTNMHLKMSAKWRQFLSRPQSVKNHHESLSMANRKFLSLNNYMIIRQRVFISTNWSHLSGAMAGIFREN